MASPYDVTNWHLVFQLSHALLGTPPLVDHIFKVTQARQVPNKFLTPSTFFLKFDFASQSGLNNFAWKQFCGTFCRELGSIWDNFFASLICKNGIQGEEMHLVFFFASEVFFALLSILQNSRFFWKLSLKFFFANRVCEMLNSSSARLSWFYILCSRDGLC